MDRELNTKIAKALLGSDDGHTFYFENIGISDEEFTRFLDQTVVQEMAEFLVGLHENTSTEIKNRAFVILESFVFRRKLNFSNAIFKSERFLKEYKQRGYILNKEKIPDFEDRYSFSN